MQKSTKTRAASGLTIRSNLRAGYGPYSVHGTARRTARRTSRRHAHMY